MVSSTRLKSSSSEPPSENSSCIQTACAEDGSCLMAWIEMEGYGIETPASALGLKMVKFLRESKSARFQRNIWLRSQSATYSDVA